TRDRSGGARARRRCVSREVHRPGIRNTGDDLRRRRPRVPRHAAARLRVVVRDRGDANGLEAVMDVELQIVGALLRAIAEEMGAALVRSAFSANIKERRDCSTALFDERGRMIAQAEHIPVHLGALPDAIAAVRAHAPAPEDVFILNDPYAGGTHLPDITLVSRTAVGFAATRAHHADVGAAEPGRSEARRVAKECRA